MLKYCIETVHKPPVHFLIVHTHDCPRFPNIDILSLSRFKDIGLFASHHDAVDKAKELNPDSYPCFFCCGDAPLQNIQAAEDRRTG